MKSVKILRFFLVITIVVICAHCNNAEKIVSVNQLHDEWNLWNNKEITLSGYIIDSGKFEEPALIWQSKESSAKKELEKFIKIATISDRLDKKTWRTPYKGMIIIKGFFRHADYDPYSMFHLVDVSEITYLDK